MMMMMMITVTSTVRHECQCWILPGLGCAKGAIERWNSMARDCPGATAWEFENTKTYYEHDCVVVVVVVSFWHVSSIFRLCR